MQGKLYTRFNIIKTLSKLGIELTFISMIKDIYQKCTDKVMFHVKDVEKKNQVKNECIKIRNVSLVRPNVPFSCKLSVKGPL